MRAASILIKPASSNCNIDCQYCFYKCLSSNREQYNLGFMSGDTLETLVKAGIAYADQYLSFAFQGGEPTLCGLDFFEHAVELQKKYNTKGLTIENTIQTNGMLLNEKWAQFLHANHFLVGLSLDGPKKLHNRYRRSISGADTFTQVMHAAELLRRYQVEFNILTVVTEETASQASNLYQFLKRNHYPYVQLIPCMDEHGRGAGTSSQSPYAVRAESYGRFLCELFDLWYPDFEAGEAMDIRMFSNLAQLAAGYPAEECGMNGQCSCYFVVEGNGNVYPCDFYCMDEWKLGTVKDSFEGLTQTEKAKRFVSESATTDDTCRICPHYALCRGGCRRWRESTDGKLSLNALCPAYQMFFAHTTERIQELGKLILRTYGRY